MLLIPFFYSLSLLFQNFVLAYYVYCIKRCLTLQQLGHALIYALIIMLEFAVSPAQGQRWCPKICQYYHANGILCDVFMSTCCDWPPHENSLLDSWHWYPLDSWNSHSSTPSQLCWKLTPLPSIQPWLAGILVWSTCDVLLGGVSSISQHNLLILTTSSIRTVVPVLYHVTNGNACPLPLLLWASYHLWLNHRWSICLHGHRRLWVNFHEHAVHEGDFFCIQK